MPLSGRISSIPRALLICQILGLCIFVAAFFLPACRDSGPVLGSMDIYPGWKCAQITLAGTFEKDSYQSSMFLAVMSGWINPLMLLYIFFSFFPRFRLVRRILAVAVLICIAATWTFFYLAHLIPLIGHFLWIGGILMILAPEVTGLRWRLLSRNKEARLKL